MLTASDIPVILNENKYKKINELLNEKIGTLNKVINNNAVKHGINYEPIARNIYSKLTNSYVKEIGIFQHKSNKWLGASPDGLVFAKANGNTSSDGLVFAKANGNPLSFENTSNKLLEIKCFYNREFPNTYYKEHWIQIQIQLEVLDKESCDLMNCKFNEYTNEEYNNLNSDLKGEYIKNNKVFYYNLDKYSIINIKRDREWYNNICFPKIFLFWKDIQYYKEKNNKKRLISIDNNSVKRIKLNNFKKDNHYKLEPYIDTSTGNIKNNWSTPNNMKNFINSDTILDWLEFNKTKYIKDTNSNLTNEYYSFLNNKSIDFKQRIFNNLKQDSNNYIELNVDKTKSFYYNYIETIKALSNNIDFVINGSLYSESLKLYNTIDIIISNKVIQKYFNISNLIGNYTIINIKNSIINIDNEGYLQNTFENKILINNAIINNRLLCNQGISCNNIIIQMGSRYSNNSLYTNNKINVALIDFNKNKEYYYNLYTEYVKWKNYYDRDV